MKIEMSLKSGTACLRRRHRATLVALFPFASLALAACAAPTGEGTTEASSAAQTAVPIASTSGVTGTPLPILQLPQLVSAGVVNATTGDFNGDGLADYADLNDFTSQFWVHVNTWNQAYGAWNEVYVQRTVTGPGWNTFVGDFDGDGFADYADHFIATGGFWVHHNNHDWAGTTKPGTFNTAQNAATGQTAAGANWEQLVADFTGDGLTDYADHNVTTGQFYIHQNLNGSFATQNWKQPTAQPGYGAWVPPTTGLAGTDVFVGDFNDDKFADYATHNRTTGQFQVFLNNKDGSFQAPTATPYATGTTATGVGWETLIADFNADGYADFADHAIGGSFYVHVNQKNGTFSTANWAVGASASGAGWAILGHDWHGGSSDSCGDAAEAPCTTGAACKSGLVALSGVCQLCGSAGEPYCADLTCNAGLVALGSTCTPCGAANEPACTGGVCNNPNLSLAFNGLCAQPFDVSCSGSDQVGWDGVLGSVSGTMNAVLWPNGTCTLTATMSPALNLGQYASVGESMSVNGIPLVSFGATVSDSSAPKPSACSFPKDEFFVIQANQSSPSCAFSANWNLAGTSSTGTPSSACGSSAPVTETWCCHTMYGSIDTSASYTATACTDADATAAAKSNYTNCPDWSQGECD